MNEVKPSLIICVPLVLEKIYRKMIVPMITKKPIRWVLAVPMLDKAIYALIRSRLVEAFGGLFEEVIVGGAPLNPEVEEFLYRIKFPFTVGYGMTECAPLISYTPWRRFSPGSCGRTLRDIMQAKIDNADADGNGEIMVKGLNVMKGYYKNEDATEAVLTEDGWLHTGDMGSIGEDGRTIFIRGRYKTMILSANGQNIYPEEIEAKLNNMAYVSECLVVERDGRLIALVYPDRDEMRQNDILADQLPAMMETTRRELNSLVAPYEKIAAIELVENEFVKTPKRSIKRTLYK
jgi:long-chain acyl-CoA synthetase